MLTDGAVIVKKQGGTTSNQVVQALKPLFRHAKIGHVGTLDPLAKGVLPICFGRATKLIPFLITGEKSYEAGLKLGIETDTQDAVGRIVSQRNVEVGKNQLLAVLQAFQGEIEQIPPMHSALKYRGRRLYQLARLGIEIERIPRKINIYSLKLLEFERDEALLEVLCSSGTYIRTLCHDIGKSLGCGAHMNSLTRVKVGNFHLNSSYTFEEILDYHRKNELEKVCVSMLELVSFLPSIIVAPGKEKLVSSGMSPKPDWIINLPRNFPSGERWAIFDKEESLLAISETTLDSQGFKDSSSGNSPFLRLLRVI